jgi:O-antigen ligase
VEPVGAGAPAGLRALRSAAARVDLSIGQLWLTIAVFVLIPLPFGATDLFWITVFTALLAIAFMMGVGTPMVMQHRLLIQVLSVCGIYAAVALVQVMPGAPSWIANPIWMQAQPLLSSPLAPRISTRAVIPVLAIGHYLLFTVALLNGVMIGASRSRYQILFRALLYSTAAYAVFGLLSQAFAPGSLLWIEKVAYRGVVTGTFVNHNTAATYFGTGCIAWLCHLIAHISARRFVSLKALLYVDLDERFLLTFILRAVGLLTCLCALVATGSRGGILCTAAAMAFAIALIMIRRNRERRRVVIVAGVMLLTAVCLVMLLDGGRLKTQGFFDQGRFETYRAVVAATARAPWLGTGAGTFQDVFPAIRSSNVSITGVWEAAHSTLLEIALEMGLPVAMLILGGALWAVFRLARGAVGEVGGGRTLQAMAAGVAVLGFLHSLIDFSLQVPGYAAVFAILLGAGLSQGAMPARSRHATPVARSASDAQS